jgi:CrcB protein
VVRAALFVGAGGFLGSVVRFAISGYVQHRTGLAFPFGTLAVNVLGCLLIGGLAELAETRAFLSPDARAFLVIGFLGGFTTYSTFGNETVNLLRDRDTALAALNVAAHLGLAIGAVWVGRLAAQLIWR